VTVGRPATGKTPVRGVRVETALWETATEVAAKHGLTASDVMRAALVSYVSKHGTARQRDAVGDRSETRASAAAS
jgi:hypothetical protein